MTASPHSISEKLDADVSDEFFAVLLLIECTHACLNAVVHDGGRSEVVGADRKSGG